jgi:hypothetical protein
MTLIVGEWYSVRIGSSEHPKIAIVAYVRKSDDLSRFHIFQTGEATPLTIHDSNIIGPHEAPGPKE